MVAETAATDAVDSAAEDAAAPASDAEVAVEETAQTRTLEEVTGETEEPDSKKAKVGIYKIFC